MKIPGKRSRDDQLTRELRSQQAVVAEAARADIRAMPPAQAAALLEQATAAADRASAIRRELADRRDAIAAVGRDARREQIERNPEARTSWERVRDEQLERRREQKRQDEAAGAEAARKRHAERVAQGRALEPLWSLDPHLQACALLASGRLWSWARGIAIEGESIRATDGSLVTWEEIRDREQRRIPQMIDGSEIVVLWSVCHLISERGTDGIVSVNPRQERLFPAGLQDLKGSLRRLDELGLLTIHETNADVLRIGWGPLALRELDAFLASFTPPKRRGRRPKITSPDVTPEPAASVEAERLLGELRARLEAEQQQAEEHDEGSVVGHGQAIA